MKEKTKRGRVMWIDCFRITAIFLMMLIHTSASQYFKVPVESYDWLIFHIYDSMAQIAVPCFVMISGIFFLDPQKNITVKNLFRKNIARMAMAFLFWNTLYVFFDYFIMGANGFTVKKEIFEGHYHLWFLFMISGLYLVTPIFRQVVKDEMTTRYFLIMSTIVGVVVPTLRYNQFISQYTGGIVVNANLSFLTSYAVYFVLGYYLYNHDISEKLEKIIYVLGAAGLLTTILLSYYVAMREKAPNAYYSNFSLFIYLQAVAVFVFFRNRISKIRFSETAEKRIGVLSECCFGMYLIHEFFNMIFSKIGFITTLFCPVISVPLINTVVFAVSFICIYLLRKISFLRKYFL